MVGKRYRTPQQAAEWSVSSKADGVTATATVRGAPGKRHYVTYVGGSYSSEGTSGEMLLWSDDKVVGDFFVHGARAIPLTFPLEFADGASIKLSIANTLLGVAGVCTIMGYTETIGS